eukprot:CAMPEP_0115011090 /NCGR_PEP_ID=MMETSP0216-20121206/23764_1 /TAXON_ID=223996 /ORGANISM="Protocruzia adherens, Strain Boccale" /LENGTH=187 /DNA_ID=CAMNT_0002379549 /DNA_START=208 /DNA_END=771 /DNA_ORIENTATION=+
MGNLTVKDRIYIAINCDEQEEVKKLLGEHGHLINEPINQRRTITALTRAVQLNKVTIARMLLEHEADPNKSFENSYTSLMWAAIKDHGDCCTLLLNHGAEIGSRDQYGLNALDLAILNGKLESAHILYSAGSQPKPADEYFRIAATLNMKGLDFSHMLEVLPQPKPKMMTRKDGSCIQLTFDDLIAA